METDHLSTVLSVCVLESKKRAELSNRKGRAKDGTVSFENYILHKKYKLQETSETQLKETRIRMEERGNRLHGRL